MIRVAIIDNHQLLREAFRSLLSQLDDIEVIFEAKNGKEFLNHTHLDSVDVALLDLDLPVLNGVPTLQELGMQRKNINVIVLSNKKDPHQIANLLKLGATGYLLKDVSAEELSVAVHSVHETGYYFNELVTPSLLIKLAQGTEINPQFKQEQLSDREKQVLRLICQEYTTSEIAEKLFLSPKTIEGHREKIMAKSGARNSAGMVVYALKNKLIHVG